MNETLKTLETRRSCRKFIQDKIPEKEMLDAIIRAGTFAPSGMGRQPVKIIAVTNKEIRNKISAENAKIMGQSGTDPFYGAPVILVVISDKTVPTGIYDGSLVMGNLLNAAESLGLGSIWIHRAKEEFESDFGKQILNDLGITGEWEGIGHAAIGYIAEGGVNSPAVRKDNVYWIE
ncbi:MAG: nitroreductase [Treponema sp.]|nr:nitroreductase [Candidatus Treponema merdequi]